MEAVSCTATNISGERVFGKFDSLIHRGPNSSIAFVESKLMCRKNNTSSWLVNKSNAEVDDLITAARKSRKHAVDINQHRDVQLRADKKATLQSRKEEMQKQAERKTTARENMITEMTRNGGLWSTLEQMNQELSKIKTDKKKELALKNQLKVRKDILEQKPPDEGNVNVYQIRANKERKATIPFLKANLCTLMENNNLKAEAEIIDAIITNTNILIGKSVSHLWTNEEGTDTWWEGTVEACLKDTGAKSSVEFGILMLVKMMALYTWKSTRLSPTSKMVISLLIGTRIKTQTFF